MQTPPSLRLALLSAALFGLLGCPAPTTKQCSINTDCAAGQICTANKCVASTIGGGGGTTGGGTGGGATGGGGGETGGGTGGGVTGGGTGGGETGGGTGGGATGGGTGGGMTGGGTGGGATGGGTGGGSTGGGGGSTGGGGGSTGGGGGGSVCGNGIVDGGEACDDGNTAASDGCSATCQVEANYTCTGTPSVCTLNGVCGNGVLTSGEACDDGNTAAGDGCSATCQVEANYTCTGTPSVCTLTAVCGNGVVTSGEACDDHNTTSGDGCSATCTIESGYTCTGAPSVCVLTVQAGEACASAVTIGANATINSTTTGLTNDYSFVDTGACQGGSSASNTAPDAVFLTTIPANSRLRVAATSTWDMVLDVISSPVTNCGTGMGAGITCLGGSDSAVSGTEVINAVNTGATALDVYILIDGYSTTGSGTFTLTTSTQALLPGDICATALVPDAGTVTATLVGYGNDYLSGTGCASGMGGADAVWQTSLPTGNRLTATVTASSTVLADGGTQFGFQPTLNFVTAACTASLTCVAGTAAISTSGTTTTTYDNVTGSVQNVLLIVDTPTTTAGGTYTLTTAVAPSNLPVGDVCTNVASAITVDTMLSAQPLSGFGNHYTAGTVETGCTFADGPDRVYAVTVPSMSRLTTIGTSTAADLLLSIVDGTPASCSANPVVCARSADNSGTGGTETAVFDNRTGASKTVLVIVDRASGTIATDTFNLGISLTVAPPIPANDTCAGAIALTFAGNTATATGDTTEATNGNVSADASPDCSGSARSTGHDVVFSYTLATARNVVITVTPTSPPATTTFQPVLYVRSACADTTAPNQLGCVANLTSTPHVLTLANQPAGTYYLWIDGSLDTAGPFSLNVTTAAPTPTVTAGETCSAPAVVGANTTFLSTTTGLANDFLFSDTGVCQGQQAASAAPDAVFRTTIPANSRLTVTTTASWDVILNVIGAPAANCGTGMGTGIVCLGGADNSLSGNETVTVDNPGASTLDVFIMVDGWTTASSGSFQVTTSTSAIPAANAGETCAAPTVVGASGTLTGQTTVGYSDDIETDGSCTGGYANSGLDRVYQVTVGAGQTLTATVTPTSWDAAIYIVESPASNCHAAATTLCLAGDDTGGSGTADTTTWTNSTGAAVVVFVVVDRYSSGAGGVFDLTINLL